MSKNCFQGKLFLALIVSAVFLLSGCQGGINLSQFPGFNSSRENNLANKVFSEAASLVSEKETLEINNPTSLENQSGENPAEESAAANEEAENGAPADNDTGMSAEEQEVAAEEEPALEEQIEEEPAPRNADLVIGIMADSHATSKTFWLINSFAKRMQAEKPDFIIEVGDFIENRAHYKPIPRKDGLQEWRTADANLAGYSPRYHVVGNHEMISFGKDDYENLTGRNSYYFFYSNGYQIIVLDTLYTCSDYKDIEPENAMAGAYVGCIPKKEKDWLKSKLKSYDKNIIFSHHPLYNIVNSAEIGDLLNDYDDRVVLIVTGHKHIARKTKFKGISYIDMPSLELYKQYAIVEVNGKKATTHFLHLP